MNLSHTENGELGLMAAIIDALPDGGAKDKAKELLHDMHHQNRMPWCFECGNPKGKPYRLRPKYMH